MAFVEINEKQRNNRLRLPALVSFSIKATLRPLSNIINIHLDRKIAPLCYTSTPYTVYQTMYTTLSMNCNFRILYSAFREYFPVRNFQICASLLRALFDYAPWLLVRIGKAVDYLDTRLGPVVSYRSPDDSPLDDRWRTVCKAP